MELRVKVFKFLTVISFMIMAVWLSELGQPVEHCHNSRELLGVITGTDENPKVLGEVWLQCEWWDGLMPRPKINSEARAKYALWSQDILNLQRLEKVLPIIQHPVLVVQDKNDPFAYSVTERKLILGEEVLKTKHLLLRALLQAWLYQVDRQGLDSFQVETLADFLMVSFLNIESYKHPITGFEVSLTQKRFWPEEAMDFKEYCYSDEASLQHLSLCRDLNSKVTEPGQNPSLWSSRLYLLSRLVDQWKQLDTESAWKNISELSDKLGNKNVHPLLLQASKKPAEGVRHLMNEEFKPLVELLGLKMTVPKEVVTHLIDWQAGELSEDFLMSLSPEELSKSDRILLRYQSQFWDIKKRRKLRFDTDDLKYSHIVRVQCSSGSLGDPFILNTEALTIIHHCQGVNQNWSNLFYGKIKKFLMEQKDLAYLKIRPKEFARYLKWNPSVKNDSWEYGKWSVWMNRFGHEKSPATHPYQGVWSVVEDYRGS